MEKKLFSFKQKSQDFIVEEELPFTPSGKWDAFFVYFEKRNLNTMDVVDHMRKRLKISRMTLGIAWLKDKKAITRQWISIYKSALKKLWWEQIFLNTLAEKTRIIKTTRHNKPIGMGTPIQNIFHIRLRPNKNLSQEEKEESIKDLSKTIENGYANLFGSQRFGVEQRNRKQWKSILEWNWDKSITQNYEIKFKLQAFTSKIFNEYIYMRQKYDKQNKNDKTSKQHNTQIYWIPVLDWDILERTQDWEKIQWIYHKSGNVTRIDKEKLNKDSTFCESITKNEKIIFNPKTMIPTWPIIWFNMLIPKSDSAKRENKLLKNRNITEKELNIFKSHKLFGLRRPMRIYPIPKILKFQNEDILLSFWLPSWAYASIIIDKLLKSY